ncbi:hypothetical protein LWI29_030351 [Acer saccharum]|uniref:High-affinity nitrate transporter n=1 Tax=Acer saccharum TaxID=4024 RepID=A0AA39VPF2_ACESA|nr:hypothetical protein LWI29_030351 [Acer saccharum]KAK1564835.1 hypothetical protein Q3G72_012618 [Acer saccharum]
MAVSSARGLLLASLLLSCLIHDCYGKILFSSLQRTLQVTTSTKQGVLKAGEDKVTVTWVVNQSLPSGTDSAYKTVTVKLCYSPVSQKDRAWRKTVDLLEKDKTCQFKIAARPYDKTVQTAEWLVEREVPTSTYFVRAYAYNADGQEVAYGQSTNDQKTTNLFDIQAISGRHASLDIASVCFSAFAVVSLFGFFYLEKRKGRSSQQK